MQLLQRVAEREYKEAKEVNLPRLRQLAATGEISGELKDRTFRVLRR